MGKKQQVHYRQTTKNAPYGTTTYSEGTPTASKIVILLVVLALAIFAAAYFILSSEAAPEEADAEDAQTMSVEDSQEPKVSTIKVTFAGDCTLGTDESYFYPSSLNAKFEEVADPSYFLKNVKDIFLDDDITVVNMEGTLTEETTRMDKTFAFKGDADFVEILTNGDVQAATIANNHSRDYGEQSFTDTVDTLEKAGIRTFGYDDVLYLDVNGVKVGLVGTYELDELDGIEESMCNNIKKAREEGAELVMLYIHWGEEHVYVPNETQMKLGHAAIDAGADVVVGSHPHVMQGYEIYNGRYIVYSLGNFCYGGHSNPEDKDCMVFQQTFTVKDGEVEKNKDVKFIPCSVTSDPEYNNYQPTPAEGEEKDRIMAKYKESSDEIAEMAEQMKQSESNNGN